MVGSAIKGFRVAANRIVIKANTSGQQSSTPRRARQAYFMA
jgi:hypothetical protein